MLNKTNLNEYPRCGEIWMCYLTSKVVELSKVWTQDTEYIACRTDYNNYY